MPISKLSLLETKLLHLQSLPVVVARTSSWRCYFQILWRRVWHYKTAGFTERTTRWPLWWGWKKLMNNSLLLLLPGANVENLRPLMVALLFDTFSARIVCSLVEWEAHYLPLAQCAPRERHPDDLPVQPCRLHLYTKWLQSLQGRHYNL